MGIERVAGEITVVGLVVDAHAKVAIRHDEIANVEVADKRCGGIDIVAIAKLAIDEQAVVEHPTTEEALILGVVPPLVARGDISAKVPVVVVDDGTQHIVDLLTELAAKNALHGEAGLLLAIVGTHGVIAAWREETADGQQVKHLLVHLFLTVDDAVNHLLGIGAYGGQVHTEVDLGRGGRSSDIHQTVHTDVIAREAAAQLQVGEAYGIQLVLGFQVEIGLVRVATKSDEASLKEVEIALDDVLDGQFVNAIGIFKGGSDSQEEETQMVEVINVVGFNVDAAKSTLEELYLSVDVQYEESSEVFRQYGQRVYHPRDVRLRSEYLHQVTEGPGYGISIAGHISLTPHLRAHDTGQVPSHRRLLGNDCNHLIVNLCY